MTEKIVDGTKKDVFIKITREENVYTEKDS